MSKRLDFGLVPKFRFLRTLFIINIIIMMSWFQDHHPHHDVTKVNSQRTRLWTCSLKGRHMLNEAIYPNISNCIIITICLKQLSSNNPNILLSVGIVVTNIAICVQSALGERTWRDFKCSFEHVRFMSEIGKKVFCLKHLFSL